MKNLVKKENLMSNHVLTVITQIMVMAVVISIMLLFIGIGILILIHLCLVGRAFRRSLTIRRRMSVDRANASSVHNTSPSSNVDVVVNINGGLSMEEVQKLPCFKYQKHGEKEDGVFIMDAGHEDVDNGLDCTECAVCLDGFQVGEKCRVLPMCRHSFHAKCVDAWLCKSPLCPICRTNAEVQPREEGGKGLGDGLARSGDFQTPTNQGSDFQHVSQTPTNYGSDFQHVSQTPTNHGSSFHHVSQINTNHGHVFHTQMDPVTSRSPPPSSHGDATV